MAQQFPKKQVLARWAYSEMLSGRYSQLSYVEPLLTTARQGKRFDDLDSQQYADLFRAWNEVRGNETIFPACLKDIESFELTSWSADQLAKAAVIPYFVADVVSPHLASLISLPFQAWIEADPIKPLNGDHARFVSAALTPGEDMEPLTVGLSYIEPGTQLVLLDGYHRAVQFWRRRCIDPTTKLRVFLPVREPDGQAVRTPNFVFLDPNRSEIANLIGAMLQAREAVDRRSWSHAQEPTTEEWWADVLADPRAHAREPRASDLPVRRAFYTLADEWREIIFVACSKCDWRAAFARDELIAAHGADHPIVRGSALIGIAAACTTSSRSKELDTQACLRLSLGTLKALTAYQP